MTDKIFTFNTGNFQFKSEGDKDFIEGYISTDDLDLVNDIVTENCMDDMNSQFKDRVIKLDFEHETFRGKDDNDSQLNKTRIPLGKAIDKWREKGKLGVKWEMNKNWKKFDEKGNVVMDYKNDIKPNIKDGYYDAFSIAYLPIRTADKNLVDGTKARLLDKVNLFNVALTGNAINPQATMTRLVMAKSLEWLKDKENKIKKKGDKMSEKKDDPKDPADNAGNEGTPAEGAGQEPGKEGTPPAEGEGQGEGTPDSGSDAEQKAKDEAEQKAKAEKDFVEVKAKIEKQETEIKTLQKENKEMKDIVEKARHNSLGAEAKDKKNADPEVKDSTGPLDYI